MDSFIKTKEAEINYPLSDYISELISKNCPADEMIDKLLSKLGATYKLDQIVIKELFDEGKCVRCSYEWSSDGLKKLINIEQRFITDERMKQWIDSYKQNPDGIFIYNKGDKTCPIKIMRTHDVKSVMQIPFFRKGVFYGCIEFADFSSFRDWSEQVISDLKRLVRIITSCLLKLRDAENEKMNFRPMGNSDYITHLPQYDIFYKNVSSEIRNLTNDDVVAIALDLSNFKYINDKYGYLDGNHILENFARDIFAISDHVIGACRPYSDDFIVVSSCHKGFSNEIIGNYIDSIALMISDKVRSLYFDCNIVINIGYYIMRDNDVSLESAIFNANLARKHIKHLKTSKGFRSCMFVPDIARKNKLQAEFLASFDNALQNNEFYFALQPVCNASDGAIMGAEALIRWKKNNEIAYPDEFLPVFEKNGCIEKLDYYIFDKVFRFIYEMETSGKLIVPIFINSSVVHYYSDNIVYYIRSLLEKYAINTEHIVFEVSEKLYYSDNDYSGNIINMLKQMGFKIVIDNFGTGYSSLNMLNRYNIDGIHIDRSFMKYPLRKNDEIIIESIVKLADNLKLELVCEGVETEEQRKFLSDRKCPVIQGYCISKPLSTAEFVDKYLMNIG